jgi:hypothetical protein
LLNLTNVASSPLTNLSNPSTSTGNSGPFAGGLGVAGAAAVRACEDGATAAGGEAMASPDPDAGLPVWSNVATEVAMSSRRDVAASSLRKGSVSEGRAERFAEGRRELAVGAEGGTSGLASL